MPPQKRSSVFQEKINRGDTAELTDGDEKKVASFFGKNRGEGTHIFLNRALLRLNPTLPRNTPPRGA